MVDETKNIYKKEKTDDKVTLWRYMPYWKLESIIKENNIYFSRADKFRDKFEGIISKRIMHENYDLYSDDLKYIFEKVLKGENLIKNELKYLINYSGFKQAKHIYRKIKENIKKISNNDKVDNLKINSKDIKNKLIDYFGEKFYNEEIKIPFKESIRNFNEIMKKDVFINCWYESENESLAMWELYAKDGFAIKVNKMKLLQNIQYEQEYAFFENVFYGENIDDHQFNIGFLSNKKRKGTASPIDKDYEDLLHKYSFFLQKKPSYEHEKEFRIIIYKGYDNFKEDNIKRDLTNLDFIEEIVVSPYKCEEDNEVKDLNKYIKNNKLNIKVKKSDILDIDSYFDKVFKNK
jgi:hypothetical protein